MTVLTLTAVVWFLLGVLWGRHLGHQEARERRRAKLLRRRMWHWYHRTRDWTRRVQAIEHLLRITGNRILETDPADWVRTFTGSRS